MILSNVTKHIILNAGHDDKDSGAVFGSYKEADLTKRVRDEVCELLPRAGFTVSKIPDTLSLKESIVEANRLAPNLNDGLCLDVHFNYASDPKVGGVETFYGVSEVSEGIADVLAQNMSAALGIRNRGARPDTMTAVGSLGWIRQTKAWATLVEVAYISNAADMAAVTGKDGFRKAALGIVNGLCELFGMPKIELDSREELKASLDESIGVLEGALDEIRDVRDRL